MKIYLARHGEAQPAEVDPEKGLSPQGRAQVEQVARFLGESSFPLNAIYHSNKARAKQTAQILQEHIAPDTPLTQLATMGPNDSIEDVLSRITAEKTDVLLVGHLPFMTKLCAALLLNNEEHNLVLFEAITVCALEKTQSGWAIDWVVKPSLIP